MQNRMQALVALGANLSLGALSPRQVVTAALDCLRSSDVEVKSSSRLFKTPAFPKGSGPDYVNAAALLEVSRDISPQAVLQHLHAVEARFGRKRASRWGARTLDIDLLALGDMVLPDAPTQTLWRSLAPADQTRLVPDQLIVPHPRLQDRAFVLVPLADVAPDWVHPLLGRSVRQMLDALSPADRAEVQGLV